MAHHLGASPSKRMVASWSGSLLDPTEYKVAARCFAPNGRLPSIALDALANISTYTRIFPLDRKSPIQSSG